MVIFVSISILLFAVAFAFTKLAMIVLFTESYPHLQKRLSQVQIAAYLGVTP
jgi:hypothetical protein